MRITPRLVLQILSVVAFGLAISIALLVLPRQLRGWLFFSSIAGVGLSISSAVADPRELVGALLFGLPTVIALVAVESLHWLIGPLTVLVLLGAELNAWSWSVVGPYGSRDMVRARARATTRLALLALVASVAAGLIGRFPFLPQPASVVLGAGALVALGALLFRSSPAR